MRFLGKPIFLLILLISAATGLLSWSPASDQLAVFLKLIKVKHKLYAAQHPQERLYLMVDKTLYEPGEVIWYSIYAPPVNENGQRKYRSLKVELVGPNGSVIATRNFRFNEAKDGHGSFSLKEDEAGGLYKIRCTNNDRQNSMFEKEVQVQNMVLPRLKLTLDFERKAYGPGSHASAKLIAFGNNNKPIANTAYKGVVSLNGQQVQELSGKTDAQGESVVRFDLPKKLSSTDGLLTLLFQHEGSTESVSRSIPIVLNKIQLSFFPEGGDLVEGLPSRVAFRAINEFKKPADISGEVVDDAGNVVAQFSSFHDGMGDFRFTPGKNKTYRARLVSPAGIDTTYELPVAGPAGFVLETGQQKEMQLPVTIYSTIKSKVALLGQINNRIVHEQALDVKPGPNSFFVSTADMPIGVMQLTLFDNKTIERAERLVLVNAHKQLHISVKADKEKYLPREKVKLKVQVTDEQGMPMPADLSLAVVDDQLLTYADDKQSNILTQLLVESELKEKVHEPRFYFDPKEEKAPIALDLLLRTSGWRRFVWAEIQQVQLETSNGYYQSYLKEETEQELRNLPGTGKLQGKVTDARTGEEIPFANIVVKQKGVQKAGGTTDFDGIYVVSPLAAGVYDVEVTYVGFIKKRITGVTINIDQTRYLNVKLDSDNTVNELQEVEVVYVAPIIDADNTTTATTFTKEQIQKMPGRETRQIRQQRNGAGTDDRGGLNVKGNRAAGTQYYINGVKVIGSTAPQVPASATKVKIKGVPAQYENGRQVKEPEVREIKAVAAKPNANAASSAHDYTRIREFVSPVYAKAATPAQRTDFRTTLFWKPHLVVDRTGKAEVEFYMGDNISSYNICFEGIAADGTPGRANTRLFTQLPVSLACKLPATTVAGDQLSIPLILTNNTGKELSSKLEIGHPEGWKLNSAIPTSYTLKANSSETLYLNYEVLPKPGQYEFTASVAADQLQDGFSHPVKVEHKGYPVNKAVAGSELSAEYQVDLSDMLAGTLEMSFSAYPSIVDDLLKGVEGILREPYGCFEQTSTTSYPNVFVLEYLRLQKQPDLTAMARAEELLDKGYNRLITFETKDNGYDWFGRAPAHEALTAYGILQFADMQRVGGKVNPQMMARTQQWLQERRDGNGGFKMNANGLDRFGRADAKITDAYIVWALSEAGIKDLKAETQAAHNHALSSNDPYEMALVSNSFFAQGDKANGQKLLDLVLKQQNADGSFTGKKHSVTSSTGNSLTVETTSLALLAMLKAEQKPASQLQSATKYLLGVRNGHGYFGSTQATILALKALTAFATYSKRAPADGTIEVRLNGKPVAERSYKAGDNGEVRLDNLQKHVKDPGTQHIKVDYLKTKTALPYTLAVDYFTALPPTSKECKVTLQTSLGSTSTTVGNTVRYTAKLQNTTQEGLPMTMVILGIPGGLTPQPWQLKELQDKAIIDYYEINGNKLYCYFRALAPGAEKTIALDLKADFPGSYEAPAASAYLYYTAEHKYWVPGVKVEVK